MEPISQRGKRVATGRGRRFSNLIFEDLPVNYTHTKHRPVEELAKDLKDQDIVCVPSLSMHPSELAKVSGWAHYEERSLFSTLFLKHHSTRLVYVTSVPIDEKIVQYYISLMNDISPEEIRRRVTFLSANDYSTKSLSEKILERPRLINRIKALIRPGKSCMLCFSTTKAEQELAAKLGIALIGCDPKYEYLGSKSGSRDIFQACDVPHPQGVLRKTDAESLSHSISELLNTNPISAMVVKLDHGFSGHGNALLDLSVFASTKGATPGDVMKQMAEMKFFSPSETWESFKQKIPVLGAIAEEYVAREADSPSVQGYITLQGDVELLSTHDQMLKGQIYQGCIFPAPQGCRVRMSEYAAKVGKFLADKGARGYYGVDFLVPKDSPEEVYALEINLRQGGTTHPYFTMKLLTGGAYDKKTGLFYSNKGVPKFYRATDNLHKLQYCGLLPADLLDIASAHDLRYSPGTQTGVVFHLLGALSEHGKVGFTAIANSAEEAEALYNQVEQALDSETQAKKASLLSYEQPHTLDSEAQTTKTLSTSGHTLVALEEESNATVPSATLAATKHTKQAHLSPKHDTIIFGSDGANVVHVFVTVCVHGDEVCGLLAVNELIDEGFLEQHLPDNVQITIMCANPLAVTKNVRFIDQNLNRAILPHLFEAGGYETFRARNIANHIFEADVYMDMHSTSSPTPPMCLPAANHASEELARNLPVDYVVEELAHATEVRGTTIDWAYFHRKTAVSVECGQHKSPEAVQVAKRVLQSLVSLSSPTTKDDTLIPSPKPIVMRCVGREKVAQGFKFTRQINPFEHVKKGEVLAQDDSGPLVCPFDEDNGGAVVIMPTSKPYIGEEAFFWVVPSISEIEEEC